jgi:hypothetical protein
MGPQTVRQGTADCPHPCRGLSGLSRGPSVKTNRTSSGTPRTTDRPRGARGLSARHPRTVRSTHADRPKLRPTKTQNHDGSKRKASKNTKNTGRTIAARTVCQEGVDRPKLRPTKTQNHDGSKRKASKNTKNTGRTRAARTVCQEGADRPQGTDRAEKRPTSKVNSPKSSSDFPNGRSCGDKGLGI